MRKKMIMMSFVVLFSVALNATYTDEERIKDMQVMEEGMSKIQKGLLTNNKKVLNEGVDLVQEVTHKVEPPIDRDSVLSKKTTFKYKFSKKQGEKIIGFAEEIRIEMEKGNKHGASKGFVKVLDESIACHNKIRKWQDR